MKNTDTILQALPLVGSHMTATDLWSTLYDIFRNAGVLYPGQKASGSIGGASRAGTIVFIAGTYVRVR